jgi:chemotaxis protein MotB
MKNRKKIDEHENHERWLVSYADFITLLFAFFVVMYATSTQNVEKEKKFENAIRAQFSMAGNVGQSTQQVAGAAANRGDIIDPIDLIQRRDVRTEELEETVIRLLDKNMSPEEKKKAISGVRIDNIGVRITLNAANFFPPGSADLKRPAFESLNKVAKILKMANRNVIIEGHTDDTPVVGNLFNSNWELASLRATSVLRYLIKVHKYNPAKLSAMSYADQRPLVPNTTEENRNQNRRIEILIINSGDDDR